MRKRSETRSPIGLSPTTISRLQWIALPLLGAFAGAWATGFQLLPVEIPDATLPSYDQYLKYVRAEQVAVGQAATVAGFFAGLANAVAFRSTVALREGKPILHLFAVALATLVAHVLWVEPFWGFHHDHTIGILAWFVLLFEEGSFIGPNWITAPVTLAVYLGFVFLARFLLRRITRWPDLPTRRGTSSRQSVGDAC